MPREKDAKSRIILDALTQMPERYGSEGRWREGQFVTDTNIALKLDWNSLQLQQSGTDTKWINRFYSWHYLQWTGNEIIDRILGVVGLVSLMVLTILGLRLLLK